MMIKVTRKRVFLGGATLLVLAALVYGFMPDPVAVQTARVTRGPLQVVVEEEGETRLRDTFVVTAPVTAYVRRVELEEGDRIHAGQELVQLEPPRSTILDPRARSEAAARVQTANAALAQADAVAANAGTEKQRLERLAAAGSATRQSLEQAQAEAARTAAARDAAQAELSAAQAALRATDGSTTLTVQEVIQAPAAGRVLAVHHRSSGHVNPGEELLEIGDTEALEVTVDVLSQDAVRITPGTPVIIDQWGGDTPLEGTVSRVEPRGFAEVSALGVEERRVTVRADLGEHPANLGPGYRVLARFVVWEDPDVLQVPTSALFRYAEGWAVFRVDGGRAARQEVEIGQQAGLAVQILEGLTEGEQVIVHPGNELEDGARVRPEEGA